MVAVAKRLKRRPGESTVSAFIEVLARPTEDRRACRVEVNHGLHLEVRLENLVMTGACLSSNEESMVLYENRRESSDSAGAVMRVGNDSKSEKKPTMLMECRYAVLEGAMV